MRPVLGRLHAQGLDGPRPGTLVDVVRHLGCVQSQLHDMALWGVGRRLPGTTLAELQQAFDTGEVLRTHVLRPTWHLVAPDDLPWLQALTGPRVRRLLETTNRSIGLTSDVVDRGASLVVEALADGRPRTRRELADVLAASGLVLTGQAVAHVVISAEIDAAIASGPMDGKQHTYRLIETRPVERSRDELLAEVARRYAAGHGPVRDRDLAWWTSLTLTDSRRAIDLAGLRPLDVDGVTHWALDEPVESEPPEVMLLPNFDEYVSYARDPGDDDGIAGAGGEVMRAAGLLFVAGRLAGSWTRTLAARTVAIDVRSAAPTTASLRRGLQAEADAFGRFVEREPRLSIAD
ncbi:winged helix DNA-binding domain-containing protein [Aeromicrobium endophyticum]|uniref:Winged helix DNA-binding domain-containing protein n=1 Tax=Aeromicrobium endophyticum TaxID=2292704 RepID=A0A371P0V0_9ACTN|nr:winged helix DNA-binding domain-containing protein [Aeromicrobium endophyticum]REK68976.1 winged helix DNA-binding domain-containing protein [Aeromicrobium endophyticum]